MSKNKKQTKIGQRIAGYGVIVFTCIAAVISIRCKDNCVGQPPVLQPAYVRFINASPDSPPVDMIVDSTAVVSQLAFNSYPAATSGYRSVQPTIGATLSVRFSGTTTTSVTAPVSFSPGRNYTVVLLNKKNSQQLLVLSDTLDTPPTDSARVRFIHAIPDLSSINVAIAGKPVATGLSFGHSSGYITMHTLIPPDTGSLQVTDGAPPYTSIFNIPSGSIILVGSSVFTIIVLGDFNPTGSEPLPTASIFLDNSPSANGGLIFYDFAAVRFLNLIHSQITAGLNIFYPVSTPSLPAHWRNNFPGQAALNAVPNDSLSSYILLNIDEFAKNNNGDVWLGIQAVNSNSFTDMISDSIAIAPFIKDHRYTVAAVGKDTVMDQLVVLQDTLSSPPSGMAAIRFFNASPDPTTTASLSVEGGQSLYSGVGFKQATQSVLLPAGNTTFVLGFSNGATTLRQTQLTDGGIYTFAATGVSQDSSYALKIYEK